MIILLLCMWGCEAEKLPLTLDTYDTGIVWVEPTTTGTASSGSARVQRPRFSECVRRLRGEAQ